MPLKANSGESSWDSARANARAARKALLRAAGLDLPDAPSVPLLDQALAAASLQCLRVPARDSLLSGAHAVLDPEAGVVWVRDDARPEISAVYVAHEIAHFHLHENGDLCRCSEADFADADAIVAVGYGPRQRRETEANVWAREFLLPSKLAEHLFYDEGLDAHVIATRLGLPLALVFGQLAEALCVSDLDEPTEDEEAAEMTAEIVVAAKWPLDPSQAAAAFAERGPLLVGAGPGTGKTRTLTERVLHLTGERAVRPENLLALTFSRKAAEEMRERIAIESPETARRAAISTFHAFGLDLLRRHGGAIGLPPIPVLLDLSDACALLERNIGSLGLTALRYLHDPAYPLPEILRMIGHAKEDLITPEAFAYRAEASDDGKLIDVAKVYHAYERLLRAKGAIDFSDLIYRALRLLQENADVRAAEQAQWQQILVDEYQDVNRSGALLVQALAGSDGAAGLWAVGDLRQAIYRFRGASPANVTRFQIDFPEGRRLELSVNYRSRPPLVRLFGRASGEGSAMWQASRPDDLDEIPAASLAVADDDIAQADGIARKMHKFRDFGYAWSDQVVLCRTRGQAQALRARLSERGIAVAQGPENYSPLGARDVRDLIALLSRVSEPGSAARHLYPTLPEGVAILSWGDAYDFWTEALWGRAGMARTLTDPASIVPLLTLARAFRDRTPVLVDESEDPRLAFLQHIRRLKRLGMPIGSAETIASDADEVRIMTVHASKGLEFPVVFVPNVSAGKFPTRPMPSLIPALPDDEDSPAEDSDSAEEERLFFVALTRARDHLVVSRALKYGNISAKASPLLDRIEDTPEVRNEVWERSDDFAPDPLPEEWDEESRDVGEDSDSAEPIESRDADLYLRCPRRYFYQRVEKVKSSDRSPYSAFKSAVSEALSSPDPASALDAAWALRGPDPADPQSAFYRAAADEILAKALEPLLPVANGAPKFTISLQNGEISVSADGQTAAGTAEFRTFRKPPTEETVLNADRRQGLLQEAVQRQSGHAPALHMRYLQSGDTRPIADKPKQRIKHLAEYDRALRGIRFRVFPAVPADANDCAGCPYLFICPD